MCITQKYDWFRIGKFKFQEGIFDFNRIITISLVLYNLLNGSQLTTFGSSLDVFVMNLFVVGAVNNCSKEEEDTFK